MVVIRSVNDIILNLIDLLRLSRPDLDTKPATVARDLVIDAPSSQIALLYDEVSKVSDQQSLRLVVGSDLDKLAKNFGIVRRSAVAASGVALLTFNNLQGTININKGDLVSASNGFSYSVINGVSITPSQANFYKSVATKFRNDLDFVGIQDQFAVEITVQSTTVGSAGNISKYSLIRTSIPGISNITNTNAFSGGSNQEDDATFRNRILSVFSGSSVGTALGYKNAALATDGVQDAYIVEPGDVLMTRDGTVVSTDSGGNKTIVSEGSGGKVDVVILGSSLIENVDSFIYKDASNKNDPTDSKNIVVLGQIAADANKTINKKRIDDIANGILPNQPVLSLVQVSASLSGTNFLPKSVDTFGRVSGNYELIKDTGVYGGSPFGFDSFHWIDNNISFQEDRIKGKFDGQDNLTFSDVIKIPKVQQNISITNENSSSLASDRSLVQLLHTPATNITRVFNVNTGERYTVINQNVNGTGTVNSSGVIKISGNTLPSPSDVLQVDYTWIFSFDQYSDYDGRVNTNNLRAVSDSTDWGYSNLIRSEIIDLTKDGTGNFFSGNTIHPISSVINTETFLQFDGVVSEVSSGTFAGRLSVVISNLLVEATSIDNIFLKNTLAEVYNTAQSDGSFTSSTVVVGIAIEFITTIILPTDTRAQIGDSVSVVMNSSDIFNTTNSVGTFTNNKITIPAANLNTTATNVNCKINYIANIQNIITAGTTALPASRTGNGFTTNTAVGFKNNNVANISRREFQIVQKNLSNQFYVELSLSSNDASLTSSQVINAIRLSDGKEIWSADDVGTVAINSGNNNYQLIFDGYTSPVLGDRLLISYYANDLSRWQPFTFENQLIERDFDTLQFNSITNQFLVHVHNFVSETNLHFQMLEPNTDIVLASGTDGYIISNGLTATFGSASTNFASILDGSGNTINVLFKKMRVLHAFNPNNNNIYDITAFNASNNSLTLSNNFSKINKRQISIIRLADGQDLWSDSGTIDLVNNNLLFPATSNASPLDKVAIYYYGYSNLKQAPTRLSVNISDQVNNAGVLSFNGHTITKAEDIVFTATSTGLKLNLTEAFKKAVGTSSNSNIPSNVKLVRISKLEKVSTFTIESDEVLTVNATYDVSKSIIQDNTYYISDFISDQTLSNFDFVLPSTSNNTLNSPKIGDRLRATFYYLTTDDAENVSFTRNGTLYTNKYFALINKIFVSSGFNASQSAKLTLNNLNQPITGSRYKAFYNYLAPKPNERIIVRYNNNKLIADATFNVENSRPINADVLVREAKQVLVDLTINIVISSQSITSSTLILQNVKDALIAAINSTSLGTSLDSSSLINTAFSVSGVAGARIISFNKTGSTGQVLSIKAQNDEFLVANNITVNPETR